MTDGRAEGSEKQGAESEERGAESRERMNQCPTSRICSSRAFKRRRPHRVPDVLGPVHPDCALAVNGHKRYNTKS